MRASGRLGNAAQDGAVLVVLLVMMVVVTLLALSSVRSTTMEERMVGNARDREKAFQATEAAVRSCLDSVVKGTYPAAKILTPVAATDSPSTPNWDVDGNWVDAKTLEVNVGDSTLKQQPRCMVEALGVGTGSFRVTGKGQGGAATTVVMLQATYSPE